MAQKLNSLEQLEGLYQKQCEAEGVIYKNKEARQAEAEKAEAERRKKAAAEALERHKKAKIKMEQEKYTVKVIKKEADGVTLKTKGMTQKMSWDEFNKNFEPVPGKKFVYRFTEEFLTKGKEIMETVDYAVIRLREIRVIEQTPVNDRTEDQNRRWLNGMAVVGTLTEKIANLAGCSEIEAAQLVQQSYDKLFNPSTGLFAKNMIL